MTQHLNNPPSISWSHSDSTADFYELPTDGKEIHQALDWLLQHYESVKLWMGVESCDGAELFLSAFPSKKEEVVSRLAAHAEQLEIFDQLAAKPELAR
ncbi:MAG: hypothetical protein AAF065_05930 [Verrucomicrobiota bacterium]